MNNPKTKTDFEIQQDVTRELAWDTRVAPTNVDLKVKDGIVTLSGAVDSWAKVRLAEEAARRVEGVLEVTNQLNVVLRSDARRTDTEIAQAVRHALEIDVLVPDRLVRSKVTHGVVTLEGTVPLWNQRHDAECAVERLAGVKAVRNRIEVQPTEHVDIEQARGAVDMAIERHAAREAARVSLSASPHDGTVEVRGIVHTWRERRAVLGAVRGTRGVRAVEDHLRVQP
jgi:osmotically-inducible protein OsmY